jgi:hypothetical protein
MIKQRHCLIVKMDLREVLVLLIAVNCEQRTAAWYIILQSLTPIGMKE